MFYGTKVQSESERGRASLQLHRHVHLALRKRKQKNVPKLCSMEKSKSYLGMSDAPSPSPEMPLAQCESLGNSVGLEQRRPSAHAAIVRALGGLSLVLECSVHKPQEV